MATVRIKTAQNIDIDYEVATVGDRILAHLLDWLVFIAFLLVLLGIGSSMEEFAGKNTYIVIGILAGAVLAFYDLASEVFFEGQSIGKRALKIKVVSLDGGSPTLGQYLLRWSFRLVDFLITSQAGGLISVIVTENHQRIGDIVAGTTVIKTEIRTKLSHVGFAPPSGDYTVTYYEAASLKDSEVELIYEVARNFRVSENYALLHRTAAKIQEHLAIADRFGMDDFTFLKTVVRDFNFIQAAATQEAKYENG